MQKIETTPAIMKLTGLSEAAVNEIRFNAGYDYASEKLPALPTSVWNNTKYWGWWMRVCTILEKSFIGNVYGDNTNPTPQQYRSHLAEYGSSFYPAFWSDAMIRQGNVNAFNNNQNILKCQE